LEEQRKAVDLAPDNLGVQCQLAWLLATLSDASIRNGKEAVQLAQRAADLTQGRDPDILRILAAALAEQGRFDEAKRVARTALGLAEKLEKEQTNNQQKQNLKHLEAMLNRHLSLYELHLPERLDIQ
jgi:Flp pilus assembly protein TadD